MSRIKHITLSIFIALVVLISFLFGGIGITAHAASTSLPGDPLFPLKTKLEETQIKITDDSVVQARLYLQFAGRRLSEMQTLIDQGRSPDIALATSEFANNLQKALSVSDGLSQTDPVHASALNSEILVLLQDYNEILAQSLVSIPSDIQPVVERVDTPSQPSASNGSDDDNNSSGEDSSNDSGPVILPTMTPIILVLSTGTSTSSPASSPTGFVIEGDEGTCQGFLGAVTVENLEVSQGASCMLDGTRVQGNIFVKNGASLTAQRVTVIGNIQAEGASSVAVLAGSTVGGSIQLKQGGAARVENVIVNGDIQFESNQGAFNAIGNQVGGNVQGFLNVGGVTIADNTINGNLQCKENNPPPAGGNNTVQGNKEDQCAGL